MPIPIDTYKKAGAIKYIFSKCPTINLNSDLGVTLTDIVMEMEDYKNVEKIITFFNHGYKESEIILFINKSDEEIEVMTDLILNGIKFKMAFDIICLPKEDILHAFNFLFKYYITDADMITVLANNFENMFSRMSSVCENNIPLAEARGGPTRIHIMTAYKMVNDNNDTDEIIQKTLSFMKIGMNSINAYHDSIKF
jgi:hypothetical protein